MYYQGLWSRLNRVGERSYIPGYLLQRIHMRLIKNRSRLSLLKQFRGTNYWYNIVSERRQVPMSTYSIIPITLNSRTGKTDTNYNDRKQIRDCLRWRWSALPGKGPQGTFRGDKNVSWEKLWLQTVYTFVRTCQIEDIKYIHFIIHKLFREYITEPWWHSSLQKTARIASTVAPVLTSKAPYLQPNPSPLNLSQYIAHLFFLVPGDHYGPGSVIFLMCYFATGIYTKF